MKKYVSLYLALLKQNLKVKLEYRINFFIGAISTFTGQLAGLLTLWVVMAHVPLLKGWTLPQLLLIYSLLILSRSINHIFADNLWRLGWRYIRTGDFDRYLVRPINPLFQLMADRFCEDGIGNLVMGLALLVTAVLQLHLHVDLWMLLYLTITVLGGALIFTAINLITSSLSFWMTDSLPIMWGVLETQEFARYPLTIYHAGINVIFTWILPYGLITFYPARYLLGQDPGPVAFLAPVMGVFLMLLGYAVWSRGMLRYTSTGN